MIRGFIIIPMFVKKLGDCNRVFENFMNVAVLLFVINYKMTISTRSMFMYIFGEFLLP